MNRNTGRREAGRLTQAAGVTLVELLVAVVLLAVVAMTAWFVYAVNQRAFREGREKMLVQQNASWCLEAMARDIRQAWRVDYVSPTRIVLYEVGGQVLSTWELGTVDGENRVKRNSLAMTPEECTALVFSIENADSSTVGVELELMDDAENRVRLLNKTSLRNHEAFGT